MDEFSKKDVAKVTVGQPATFTFGGKKGSVAVTSGSTSDVSVDGGEVSSYLGPHVQKEISVKTDYDIETSPPSPSPEDGGLMYTMKKTLVTTTKEVTTLTRQEIKTELEVVHVDSENELPRRIGVQSRESDRVGVSVTTVSGVAKSPESQQQQEQESGNIGDTLKKELQDTNENICKGVEGSLFAER